MLRSAQVIQLCVVALLGVGLVMTQSAGMSVTDGVTSPESRLGATFGLGVLTGRNAIYAALAIIAMLFASRLNVRQLFHKRGWHNPLGFIVLGALVLAIMTLIPGVGRSVNGASRWLHLGPAGWGVSFQPSELVKWVMVVALAWWCARRRGVMHRFWHGLVPAVLLIGAACGIIVIEDLGTAALIGLVAVCLLYAGGARAWQLLLIFPGAAVGLVAAVATNPYRIRRLTAFLDPWADAAGAGYHPIQSLIAIAQGGLTGRGLGNGLQKFGYLPEDTTDFIFAIVCEELGTAGAALVIVLYLVILWFGLGIVRDCKDTFGRLLALGVLLTVGFQAAINIAVVTVVVPTKGIALPLISSGGTGWIVTAFALGLVAALDYGNELEEQADGMLIPEAQRTQRKALVQC